MKIPRDTAEQWILYENVVRDCFASQNARKVVYDRMRSFYLYGTDTGDTDTTYNKIFPHIDQILSFEYSNETTSFSANIGAGVDKVFLKQVPSINRLVNNNWHSSNGDITFQGGLEWAHVYGSTHFKTRWNGKEIEPGIVDPYDFGVLREDVSQLSRQEAFAQSYWITKSQLEMQLKECEHPRASQILSNITASPKPPDRGSERMNTLLITSQMPIGTGGTTAGSYQGTLNSPQMYIARTAVELVKMYELYVYDNKESDFRVITIADPYVVIFDRPINRMFVPDEIPFVQICPNPKHDYYWGGSDVERLIPLQLMRNERMAQIRRMMDMQAKPPTALIGFEGMSDEMKLAMDSPGGWLSSDSPASKVERLAPVIPDDLFVEVKQIDNMFDEMSGLTNVTSGRGEAGVRSSGHASQLANLGSARIKKRAMIIEDALEKTGTLYLQMVQRFDDSTQLKDEDGTTFMPSQFTSECVVKVDGHSNSPIFMEELRDKATALFNAKAITRERYIELLHMPMEQLLLDELKSKIEPAESRAADEQKKLKLVELESRHRGTG